MMLTDLWILFARVRLARLAQNREAYDRAADDLQAWLMDHRPRTRAPAPVGD